MSFKAKLTTYSEIDSDLRQETILTLSTFHKESYLDESFMSAGRWSEEDEREYLISVFQGMCLTPYIMVDVNICLARATAPKDKNYFQKVKDMGYKYITCDSNNRQLTLWKGVAKGTINLPAGIFTILGHIITIEPNTKFTDLDSNIQALIWPRSVPVQYIEKATRQDLSTIFYRVNLGKTQNPQEMRQSWESTIAQPIRDLSKTLYESFIESRTVEKKEVNRRLVDEIVLDSAIFAYTEFGTKINKSIRDSHYAEVSQLMNVFSIVKKCWGKITILKAPPPIQLKNGKTKNSKPLITIRSIMNNIMLRIWVEKNGYIIVDDAKFDSWCWRTDLDFMEPAVADQVKFIHPAADINYPYRSTGRRDAQFMKFNFNLFLEALIKTEGLITLDEKDDHRLFTPAQHYTFWKRQVGVCPATDKVIPLKEILDSTKWQADHYPIRWTDNGPTTIENGRLICAVENSKTANRKSVVIPKAV